MLCLEQRLRQLGYNELVREFCRLVERVAALEAAEERRGRGAEEQWGGGAEGPRRGAEEWAEWDEVTEIGMRRSAVSAAVVRERAAAPDAQAEPGQVA